jgi:hypothetical protein
MKVQKKTFTRFLNGAFVIALLIHICASCSPKAQGFTFKDDEPKELHVVTVEKGPLLEITSDNYFGENKNEAAPEANKRIGKELEPIELEEISEDSPPRFARKIISSIKPSEIESGKMLIVISHAKHIKRY